MPLRHGYSETTLRANIAREIRSGREPKQAEAIAFAEARKAWRARHPRARLPAYLEGAKRRRRRVARNPARRPRRRKTQTVRTSSTTRTVRTVKRNPAPRGFEAQAQALRGRVEQAAHLYEKFSGHAPRYLTSVRAPKVSRVLLQIGPCAGILYRARRDGSVKTFLHQFDRKSAPLLCSSSDGKQLYLLGGAYDFTEDGIVDRD